jgi:bacillithiol system protein YtxJ
VNSQQDCDALFAGGWAVLFKHSPSCPLSWVAHRQIIQFRKTWLDAPVHLVSVRRQRALSRYIAERTGIEHQSPQILVLSQGKIVATASHADITAELLTSAWRQA